MVEAQVTLLLQVFQWLSKGMCEWNSTRGRSKKICIEKLVESYSKLTF